MAKQTSSVKAVRDAALRADEARAAHEAAVRAAVAARAVLEGSCSDLFAAPA